MTLLTRTTAFGYYDGNLVGAIERVTDHLAVPLPHLPRQRMWMIRAQAVVLASGAIERGIAYANNDLPGTMLAGAAHTYVRRYGVQARDRARSCSPTTTAPTRRRSRCTRPASRSPAIVDVRAQRQGRRAACRRARAPPDCRCCTVA